MAFAGLVIVSGSGQQAAREPERIIAKSIPECLHIGDVVEALVLVDAGEAGDKFDLAISAENNLVSATPELSKDLSEPIAVIFRGEKFGEDRVSLHVPGRPDIAPLITKIRVLPSFEPPQGLTTHPTTILSYSEPDPEGSPLEREIILRWWPKIGVQAFGIDMFSDRRRQASGTLEFADTNSAKQWALPGERHYWSIHAKIDTCTGGEVWTPSSPLIPFDS